VNGNSTTLNTAEFKRHRAKFTFVSKKYYYAQSGKGGLRETQLEPA